MPKRQRRRDCLFGRTAAIQFEELLQDETKRKLLELLDVLVDGRFVLALKDYRLKFKGSRNQRIIDVQESLQSGMVVLSSYDDENQKLD